MTFIINIHMGKILPDIVLSLHLMNIAFYLCFYCNVVHEITLQVLELMRKRVHSLHIYTKHLTGRHNMYGCHGDISV